MRLLKETKISLKTINALNSFNGLFHLGKISGHLER